MTAAHALGSLSALAVAPLAPFLLDGLGLSRVQVGLFLPAVYLGGVLMSLPAGWLTERFGVRWLLAVGLAVSGSSVALGALAPGLTGLLALLFLGGFGFSILNPTTGRAVFDWFPARERGLAMGIKQAGLTLGGIVSALALPPIAAGVRLAGRPGRGRRGVAGVRGARRRDLSRTRPIARRRRSVAGRAWRTWRPSCAAPASRSCSPAGWPSASAQSSVLAYLVLFARETFGMSSVDAARLLALAHLGGMAGRLGWGAVSDRVFGGRRRPASRSTPSSEPRASRSSHSAPRSRRSSPSAWPSSWGWAPSGGWACTSRSWPRSAARASPAS